MSACDLCAHPYTEHDGMGDCGHPDGRTATGFCTRHNTPTAPNAETLAAWFEWSHASGDRYGEPMMAAFRSGYRIGFAPATPDTLRRRAGRTAEAHAWVIWCAKSDNTRYGSLNYQAFIAGHAAGVRKSQQPEFDVAAGARLVLALRAELAALRA